jgi:hypothetical protein
MLQFLRKLTLEAPLPKLSALAKATSSSIVPSSGATNTASEAFSSASAKSGVGWRNAGLLETAMEVIGAMGANAEAIGRAATAIRLSLVIFDLFLFVDTVSKVDGIVNSYGMVGDVRTTNNKVRNDNDDDPFALEWRGLHTRTCSLGWEHIRRNTSFTVIQFEIRPGPPSKKRG